MNSVLLIGSVEMLWHHVWDNGSKTTCKNQRKREPLEKGFEFFSSCIENVTSAPCPRQAYNIQTGSWSSVSEAPILRSSTQPSKIIRHFQLRSPQCILKMLNKV